jgi:hypothetical protein
VQHQEPPEVAWLLPELETGAELELKPDDPVEVPDPVEDVPDPVEDVPDPVEDVPDPVDDVLDGLELDFAEDEAAEVSVLWVDPGRTSATAPAAAMLAMPTAVVAVRTLARPRCLAATARRTWSRCALFMSPILRSGTRSPLRVPSRLALRSARIAGLAPRLRTQHEGHLKPSAMTAVIELAASRLANG